MILFMIQRISESEEYEILSDPSAKKENDSDLQSEDRNPQNQDCCSKRRVKGQNKS